MVNFYRTIFIHATISIVRCKLFIESITNSIESFIIAKKIFSSTRNKLPSGGIMDIFFRDLVSKVQGTETFRGY